MPSGSELGGVAIGALIPAAAAAAALAAVAFLFVRRIVRARYFRRRDECATWIRAHWNDILTGVIPASTWKGRRLVRRTIEEIALDRRAIAAPDEILALDEFFRMSGMLDARKYLARRRGGWERRAAIQALGRMQAVEAAPLIAEALGERDAALALEAVRALARVGTPQAGAALVARLRESLACPAPVIESALLTCYKDAPGELLRETLDAPEQIRPLLARALAEVARPGMPGDVAVLAGDPSADVRAATARVLAMTNPPGASGMLCQLIEDPVWFVRLRAAIALGAVGDPFTIPSILRALCDQNRLVRLRAACALATFEKHERRILELAHSTGDRYALQSFVGELDRAGKLGPLIAELATAGGNALSPLLEAGAVHRLEEIAARHPNGLVRRQVAHVLDSEAGGEESFEPRTSCAALASALREPVHGADEIGTR